MGSEWLILKVFFDAENKAIGSFFFQRLNFEQ